jgi:hypothetical protein
MEPMFVRSLRAFAAIQSLRDSTRRGCWLTAMTQLGES